MGNNESFSSFEAVVMACHEHKVLTKELLEDLAKPFRDTDADSGGYSGELSKDGLDLVDIVIKTAGKTPPTKPELPKDYKKWTEAQIRANDDWQDKRWGMFDKIAKL